MGEIVEVDLEEPSFRGLNQILGTTAIHSIT